MKLLVNVLFIMLFTSSVLYAEKIPDLSSSDPRIRSAVYDTNQVYRVAARIGYASYLQFWEGETLESYFTGDSDGWDVGNHGAVVAFKPRVKNPSTNFIIVTNKGRVYNLVFDLKTKVTKGHVIGLRFQYPEEERKKLAAKKQAERAEYEARKKARLAEQLKAERLLADEMALKLEKAEKQRQAQREEAERKKKVAQLEQDLRRRALRQEKHEEQLALLSLQEQLFNFEQVKRQAAFDERKRQRDEAMEIARQEHAAIEREMALVDAKRARVKRLRQEAAQEAEAARVRKEAELARQRKASATDPAKQRYRNYHYLAAGDGDLRPVEMFDNGRFTFIRFKQHIELPAVFRVRNGQETLVNSSMHEGWLVVQNLSREWKVRLDDEFICIRKSPRAS